MTLKDLIARMASFFAENRIDYFVFGATAMNFWIPPRFTHDMDVVLCIGKKDIAALADRLNAMGFRFGKSLQRKLAEGRKIILPIGRTELDLKLCVSAHDRESLKRAAKFTYEAMTLKVASPEDLVLYKLQYWRRQDQADIDKMRTAVRDLDVAYIESRLDAIERDTGHPMRERWMSLT